MENLFIIIGCNGALALGAYFKKSLTLDGALTATLVGSLIWHFGGFTGFCIMGIFFVSASLLSRFKKKERIALRLDRLHDKSDTRDYSQVLANSLVPLLFLIVGQFSSWDMWYVGFVCAFAAANADTWASEIGVLSPTRPRYLIKGSEIPTGLSGGVTSLGLISSLLGAGLIAMSFLCLQLAASFTDRLHWLGIFKQIAPTEPSTLLLMAILLTLGGFLGSIIDSLLGELFQVQYQSKNPLVGLTERALDSNSDSVKNSLVKGLPWMDNNAVNFLSVLASALITSTLYGAFF